MNEIQHRPLTATRKWSTQLVLGETVIMAITILIAAGLRFGSIGTNSFWADEAYSARVANRSPKEIITLTAMLDRHPPFYYLALSAWSYIAGGDDASLRSLSATASVLTVVCAWWLGRRVSGPLLGVVAAFLTAVSSFQVLAAQEARMYALLGLLTALSWVTLFMAMDGRRSSWVIYIMVTILALYTHYFAFLGLLGQGVFVLGADRRYLRQWTIGLAVLITLYLPWLGRLLTTATTDWGRPLFFAPLDLGTLAAFLGLLSFGGHTFGFAGWFGGGSTSLGRQAVILLPFVGVAVLGLVPSWRQPRFRWFVLGALVAPLTGACAFSLLWTNIITPRHFSFLSAPFAVLLGAGMLELAARTATVRWRLATIALGLLFGLVNAPVLYRIHFDPTFQPFNWRGASQWLMNAAGANDVIVVTPAVIRVPFSRYFRGPQRIIAIDPIDASTAKQHPVGREGRQAQLRSIATSHDVLWVVTDAWLPQVALIGLSDTLEGIYDLQSLTYFNAVKVYRTKRHLR